MTAINSYVYKTQPWHFKLSEDQENQPLLKFISTMFYFNLLHFISKVMNTIKISCFENKNIIFS